MRINKKIIISIIGFIVLIIIFGIIGKIVSDKNSTQSKITNSREKTISISKDERVTDECTEEWEEYNNELQSAFEEASTNLGEETTHFLLKSEDGYIYVYYLKGKNEEILYKKTTICVDYLSPEDIDDLEAGIEVVGVETLNKMLEDFE